VTGGATECHEVPQGDIFVAKTLLTRFGGEKSGRLIEKEFGIGYPQNI
jgi:hypothetical protein